MTPERYEKVRQIYVAARELPSAQRTEFLTTECGDDTDLRSEVESLLEYNDSDPSFLNEPALGSDFRVDGSNDADASHPEQIGSFKIKGIIGEGGMGIVYLAQQSNPDREVALKVLKTHLGHRSAIRRFELESQLLARLQHSGIAQIFEANTAKLNGTTVPYFAMEYIKGQRLNTYASTANPTTTEKLQLIIKICNAIQHAHQKGIIHRDLKPANILIDDDNQPHILDFGVARLTDADLHATLNTNTGQLIGTLPYMSPEQVTGDGTDIDTRTDIYAIGVIAYELLTGRLPLEIRKTDLLDAVRAIRELDPPPLASHDKSLAGDIDAVITKAIEKNRDDRYNSAADLADDLQRFLDDHPVSARPITTTYQLRKFARRNKSAVIIATLLLLVFIGGSVGTTVGMIRAQSAEELANKRLTIAQREAERIKLINDFLEHMLVSASPRAKGRDVKVADILESTAEKIPEIAPDDPLVQASVHHTIGFAYQGLGMFKPAEEQLRQSVRLFREHHPPEHPETLAVEVKLADILRNRGQLDEARQLVQKVYDIRTNELGDDHPDTLKLLGSLAAIEAALGNLNESITLNRKAVQSLEIHRDAPSQSIRTSYFVTLGNLGEQLCKTDQCDEGIDYLKQSAEGLIDIHGPENPITLSAKSKWATSLGRMEQHKKAAQLLAEVLEVRKRVLGNHHPDTMSTMNNYALALKDTGKNEEAIELLKTVADKLAESIGKSHPKTLIARNNLARELQHAGRLDECIAVFENLTENAKATIPAKHWYHAIFAKNFGAALTDAGQFQHAESLLLSAYAKLHETFGPDHEYTKNTHQTIEELYEKWQKPNEWSNFLDQYESHNP